MESPSDPDGSGGRDWQQSYLSGDTPWDKGRAHPALAGWLSGNAPVGPVLVPGCGAGHDVRAIAAHPGVQVLGVDVAPAARKLAMSFPPAGLERYITADFLAGDAVAAGSFQMVFEHTCFCAIPPSRRADYARSVERALSPGGLLLAVFYRNPSHGGPGEGPPFGCTMKEVDRLFDAFETLEERGDIPTFEGREGREVLRLMRKRSA